MKLRETDKCNFKLTLTPYELSVITSILNHVRLGDGLESDIVMEVLVKTEKYALDKVPVTVKVEPVEPVEPVDFAIVVGWTKNKVEAAAV